MQEVELFQIEALCHLLFCRQGDHEQKCSMSTSHFQSVQTGVGAYDQPREKVSSQRRFQEQRPPL